MWGSEIEKKEFGGHYPWFYGSQEERDYRKAIKGIKTLAEDRYTPAVYTLGSAYFDGKGVRKNYQSSFDYYLKAANEGYPSAECGVGNFYTMAFPKQNACEYDEAKAVQWWLRSAEHGNSAAQCNLANYYLTGHGVEKNPLEAYLWASLAVHCSPIRCRPAEVIRDQASSLLDDVERKGASQRIEDLKAHLPYAWSEHLVYWRILHKEANL